MNGDAQKPKAVEEVLKPMTRRTFLKGTAATVVGMAGVVAALKPLLSLERGEITLSDLLQKHYKELTPEGMDRILAMLTDKAETDYGVRPNLKDVRSLEGVQFGYALSLTKCIGCRKCAHACMAENNQSRDYDGDINMSYIRVLELDKGSINVETSNHYYTGEVPKQDKFYMPVQCHQCEESPCTKACPGDRANSDLQGSHHFSSLCPLPLANLLAPITSRPARACLFAGVPARRGGTSRDITSSIQ